MKDKILHGHVLEVLRTMPAESVDMAITSPPYWGLREKRKAEAELTALRQSLGKF